MERIPYCFGDHLYPGVPRITLTQITPNNPFTVHNAAQHEVSVLPLLIMHGKLPIVGYRIGKMAWITDMLTMPEENYEMLKDLDVLVVNALHRKPHPSHQNLEQALETAARIQAKETYFVHMSHKIGLHKDIIHELPSHVHFAYDGLSITI
jgi:phosphoribosyl 1,2-cyclic phosphate phosphodiesterase